MVDPATAAKNWVQGMSNASAKITAGIQAVTVAPTQLAAQQIPKYLQSVQDAVNSGRMAAALQNSTLQYWQSQTLSKVSRVASGASAAAPKMQTFLSKWLPIVSQVQAQVKAMPSATQADRIQRMVQNATLLGQYKGKVK